MPSLTADKQHTIEKEIRCAGCGKLLTKAFFYVSVATDVGYNGEISISKLFPAIEVKIGLETKCNRCKELNHKLTVI